MKSFLLAGLMLSLTACSSKDRELGTRPQADGGNGSEKLTNPTPQGSTVYTAEEVAEAKARCNEAGGTVDGYDSVAELQQRLAGDWYICSNIMGDYENSYRLTADGKLTALLDDGAGGLLLAKGLHGTATYSITPPNNNPYNNVSYTITEKWADGTIGTGYAYFKTSPRKLEYLTSQYVPLVKKQMRSSAPRAS